LQEGDTVDREKYYQGIKFYDPQVGCAVPAGGLAGGLCCAGCLAGWRAVLCRLPGWLEGCGGLWRAAGGEG
jgi:hypothetical protein